MALAQKLRDNIEPLKLKKQRIAGEIFDKVFAWLMDHADAPRSTTMIAPTGLPHAQCICTTWDNQLNPLINSNYDYIKQRLYEGGILMEQIHDQRHDQYAFMFNW